MGITYKLGMYVYWPDTGSIGEIKEIHPFSIPPLLTVKRLNLGFIDQVSSAYILPLPIQKNDEVEFCDIYGGRYNMIVRQIFFNPSSGMWVKVQDAMPENGGTNLKLEQLLENFNL